MKICIFRFYNRKNLKTEKIRPHHILSKVGNIAGGETLPRREEGYPSASLYEHLRFLFSFEKSVKVIVKECRYYKEREITTIDIFSIEKISIENNARRGIKWICIKYGNWY